MIDNVLTDWTALLGDGKNCGDPTMPKLYFREAIGMAYQIYQLPAMQMNFCII